MPSLKFTLDPDFLMTAAERGAEADLIRLLADHHARGDADVAIVALSPVDETGYSVESLDDAMSRLGLGQIGLCHPLCDDEADVADRCILRTEADVQLQRRIHQILFPNRAFELDEARRKHGVVEGDRKRFRRKWVEARRSVQTIWSHIRSDRDVLVSNNQNYFKWRKMPILLDLGVRSIERLDTIAKKLS